MSTRKSRHVCSKLSEAIAVFADTPHIVLSVLREREKKGKHRTVCIVKLYIINLMVNFSGIIE